jgi:hypothetical protein
LHHSLSDHQHFLKSPHSQAVFDLGDCYLDIPINLVISTFTPILHYIPNSNTHSIICNTEFEYIICRPMNMTRRPKLFEENL